MTNLRHQPVNRRRKALVMRVQRTQCDQSLTYLNQVERNRKSIFPNE